jgi:hypothetical protein
VATARKEVRDLIEYELRNFHQTLESASNGKFITCCRLGRMCETCQAITAVYNSLEPAGQRFVELKYWRRQSDTRITEEIPGARPKAWRQAIVQAIADELGMD